MANPCFVYVWVESDSGDWARDADDKIIASEASATLTTEALLRLGSRDDYAPALMLRDDMFKVAQRKAKGVRWVNG